MEYKFYIIYNNTDKNYTLNDLLLYYNEPVIDEDEVSNEYLWVCPAKTETQIVVGDDPDELPIRRLFHKNTPDDQIGWIELDFMDAFEDPYDELRVENAI